ncbi:GtrA-like protein [Candidatus Nanopelagicus limnes]|uniref:GtrA-like protein n=1 Tax=Candidatus Nanopelagicus limnae TaxID=1884634 RepID=A0A249JZB3_9ACTN|nr:GtrA family protein [Candidatus Nanopelagicus limnes]ASY09842.1 GtrA-like protein [Candidatus Nanopelagicus limnes]
MNLKLVKDKYFNYSMLRWSLVGITTTAIDYLLFILLYGITHSVYISNFLSATVATTLNYLSHYKWTFKSQEKYSKSGMKYLLNLIFWWIISTSIINFLVASGIDPRIAKLAPVIVIVPINYFVLNHLIFKGKFIKN